MNNNPFNLEDVLADRASEDDVLETPLTARVFQTFFLITLIAVIIVIAQLVNIGVIDHSLYEKSAMANITYAKSESAPRGIIKDRFGNALVRNEQAFRVFLSLRGFPKDPAAINEMLSTLSGILKQDRNELVTAIENHDWRLGRLLLADNLPHSMLVELSSSEILGVDIEPGFSRVHVKPFAFSHVIGYTGLVTEADLQTYSHFVFEDEIGKVGLERFYDDQLRGTSGKKIALLDANMEIQSHRVVQEPKIGSELKTFIDKELQEYFYERLLRQVRVLGSSGAVGIIINPQNGEVLALLSVPSFDSIQVADFLEQPFQPLFNRAVSGRYNPGSTIKPLVALAALEENIIRPDDAFFSSGYLTVPNPYYPERPSIFLDWKPHGWVNLHSALAKSSNVYFYIVGGGFERTKGLGIELLGKWWEMFRLDSRTLIDIPGEKTGFLPSVRWKKQQTGDQWRVGDTYNVSIGQGELLVTPLELINYIAAIANGGTLYKLRIAQENEPEILGNISDTAASSSLREVEKGMIDAVEKPYGTAHMLADVPFSIAAKTGSAQTGSSKTNALFVGYGPVENPEIALAIIIEDAQEGGLNALPVARDVLMWYYEHRL